MKFVQSSCDPCIYTRTEGELFIIAQYVDDLILACKSSDHINEVKEKLKCKYLMSDMGSLKYFLGVKVEQSEDSVFLSQTAYAQKVLERLRLSEANPVQTPMEANAK